MKIMMVAGEESGDTHGAALITELKNKFSQLTTYGIGGPRMVKAGLNPLYTLDILRVHGIIELIPHIPRLYKILWSLRDSLKVEKPDVVILIDYPGFNLKLARYVKINKIPLVWYSSPQVWAWRFNRVYKIAEYVDKIIVLFPFEAEIYKKLGMDVSYHGNPRGAETVTQDQVKAFKDKHQLNSKQPIITLALGSRPSEIKRHLPVILATLPLLQLEGVEATYLFPIAESLDFSQIKAVTDQCRVSIHLIQNSFLECIYSADIAVVASGTATLQTGLALTPFVTIYKVAALTYKIAMIKASIPYIGIVNIMANRLIIKELLQDDLTPQSLTKEVMRLLKDHSYQTEIIQNLKIIREQIGEQNAYQNAAQEITKFINNKLALRDE